MKQLSHFPRRRTFFLKSNDYISVELDTEKPYEYYEEHSGKYPPGQIKKGEKNLSQKCGDLRCSEIIFIDSKIE